MASEPVCVSGEAWPHLCQFYAAFEHLTTHVAIRTQHNLAGDPLSDLAHALAENGWQAGLVSHLLVPVHQVGEVYHGGALQLAVTPGKQAQLTRMHSIIVVLKEVSEGKQSQPHTRMHARTHAPL